MVWVAHLLPRGLTTEERGEAGMVGRGQDQGRPFVGYDSEVFVNWGRSSGKAGTAGSNGRRWWQAQ